METRLSTWKHDYSLGNIITNQSDRKKIQFTWKLELEIRVGNNLPWGVICKAYGLLRILTSCSFCTVGLWMYFWNYPRIGFALAFNHAMWAGARLTESVSRRWKYFTLYPLYLWIAARLFYNLQSKIIRLWIDVTFWTIWA